MFRLAVFLVRSLVIVLGGTQRARGSTLSVCTPCGVLVLQGVDGQYLINILWLAGVSWPTFTFSPASLTDANYCQKHERRVLKTRALDVVRRVEKNNLGLLLSPLPY